jgi:hypothetical protein
MHNRVYSKRNPLGTTAMSNSEYVNPFCLKWTYEIVPGSTIIARGVRDLGNLTAGKAYTAIKGREEGIFECRPFVTVVDDDGKNYCCHLDRFVPSKPE